MQEQKKYNLADGNIRKRFVTYKQAAELYSMGMNRIQEHAKAAGATYKMGNKVLINTDMQTHTGKDVMCIQKTCSL